MARTTSAAFLRLRAEMGRTTVVAARVPIKLAARLRAAADKTERTMSTQVRLALEAWAAGVERLGKQ